MQARRASRERLLQALYQARITREWSDGTPLRLARPQLGEGAPAAELPPGDEDFTARMVEALNARREELDGLIEGASRNWRLDRMSAVDISILRLAGAELQLDMAPARVVINEAVELAKKYGADNSATFVNGVLDGILRTQERPG